MKTSLNFILICSALSFLWFVIPWHSMPDIRLIEKEIEYQESDVEILSYERTFFLSKDNWLEFPLNSRVREIKILSFGLQASALDGETGPGWSMDIKLEDQDGKVLRRGQGSQRSNPINLPGSKTKSRVEGMPHLSPLQGRSWKINLPTTSTARKLFLKALPTPDIEGILVKVEAGSPTIGGLRKVMWNRLPLHDRRSLAKATVYPPHLLRSTERNNLLQMSSRPIGPDGVDGIDYKEVDLYTLQKNYQDFDVFEEPESINYEPIKPGWLLKFHIQPDLEYVEIFSELTKKVSQSKALWSIKLFDELGVEQQNIQSRLGSPFILATQGIVELQLTCNQEADIALIASLSLDETEPLASTSLNARTWSLDETITFKPHLPEGEVIPFRITTYSSSSNSTISWKIISKKNNLLSSGTELIDRDSFSPRYIDHSGNTHFPSTQIRKYFYIDENVQTIEIAASTNTWVQLHHRLPKWERNYDELILEEDDSLHWFQLPPTDHQTRLKSSLIIHSDPSLTTSEKSWHSLLPDDLPKKEALMLSVSDNSSLSNPQLTIDEKTSGAMPLSYNTPHHIEISDKSARLNLKPRLIIFTNDEISNFTVHLDGKKIISESLPLGCSTLRLPNLKEGSHEIQWSASQNKAEVFISDTLLSDPLIIRALGVGSKKAFTLNIPIPEEENAIYSIRWYRLSPGPGEFRLNWENGHRSLYTMLSDEVELSRRYRVSTNQDKFRLMSGLGSALHASQPMFYPVSRALNEKVMKLKLIPIHGRADYVSVTVGIPKVFESISTSDNLTFTPKPTSRSSDNLVLASPFSIKQRLEQLLDMTSAPPVTWPNPYEMVLAENLFYQIFMNKKIKQSSWRKLGMVVETVEGAILIREISPAGKGLFLIRPDSSLDLMVQTPHQQKDLLTGKLNLHWFTNFDFAASCWNTSPRWVDRSDGRWNQDHCDEKTSFFNSFARAFNRAKKGLVLQLHGYSVEKHFKGSDRPHEIILSSGSKSPSDYAETWWKILNRDFPRALPALFPRDTSELGALQNTQGHALHEFGHDFLHLEASLALRRSWLSPHSKELSKLHQGLIELLKQHHSPTP